MAPESEQEILARAERLESEFKSALTDAVLFEVLVTNSEDAVSASDFYSDTTTQAGRAPVFLATDSDQVVGEFDPIGSEHAAFRVLFWIDNWTPDCNLQGPSGRMLLPKFSSVPERHWSIAPFDLLD
ncbi:hypothetical protein IP84_13925 [beta proteobacterium AAP99]|nr:hypothetical protein IP84_13925 [beta proteobacterium AAP99]